MQKNRIKNINSLIVALLGILLVLYIGLKVFYPKNDFDSTKRNKAIITTTFPTEKKGFLVVDPQLGYDFYSAKIDIYPRNIFPKDKVVEVKKGFVVQLYSTGNKIETADVLKRYIFSDNPEIPNGKLVSTNNAVYIYSRGKWNPFLGPQFFEDLSFDWDRVTPLGNDSKDSFEEGEKIIAGTPHPDGTILKAKDNNFFLVWDKELLPIKDEKIIEEVWSDYFAVSIDSRESRGIGECKQTGKQGQFRCSFLESYMKQVVSGNAFIFPFGESVAKITRSKIFLDTFNLSNLRNPKITLASYKARIIEKYGQNIFK